MLRRHLDSPSRNVPVRPVRQEVQARRRDNVKIDRLKRSALSTGRIRIWNSMISQAKSASSISKINILAMDYGQI
jgi:hypothetical protein